MSKKNIAIIGNGVYGTALAFLFGKKHDITVFGRELKHEGEYPISDFGETGKHFDYLIISITTKGLSDLLPRICERIGRDTHIILAMKGLTANGLLPIDECLHYTPNHHISVLSGPGFAEEIMQGVPIHLVLASQNFDEYKKTDFLLDGLTLDFTKDVKGVSWCGVLKNIYAIGAGQVSTLPGFDRGEYTKNVVDEMGLILVALNSDRETAHGPAGKGDMWICTTPSSRNFRYGAGDESLRDQAEGYNALLSCGSIVKNITNYPILNRIYRSILA